MKLGLIIFAFFIGCVETERQLTQEGKESFNQTGQKLVLDSIATKPNQKLNTQQKKTDQKRL